MYSIAAGGVICTALSRHFGSILLSLPAHGLQVHAAQRCCSVRCSAFLHRGLQLHAALGQLRHGLGGFGRNAPDLELVQARQLGFNAFHQISDGVVEAVDDHQSRPCCRPWSAACLRPAHFDPHALAAREVGVSEASGSSGSDSPAPKPAWRHHCTASLQLVGLQGQRGQPHHHASIRLAGVACQGESMVGVVAVVDRQSTGWL